MKICILVGPYFPVPPVRGGAVEKSIWQVAQAFASLGHEVTLLSRSEENLPATSVQNDITIKRLPGFAQRQSKIGTIVQDSLYALRWIRSLPENDILLVNDLMFPVIARILAPRQRLVVCLGRSPGSILRFHSSKNIFVVPSAGILCALHKAFPEFKKNSYRIGYSFDDDIYRPPDPKGERNDHSFLYVGRIHPEKGLRLLVSAFKRFTQQNPQARLSIMGPSSIEEGGGGSAFLRELKELAPPQITFFPAEYDEKKLATHYQAADFFCYPSLAEKGETFGVSVLESMACGCIPIVSSLPCFADLVVPDHSGFVFNQSKAIPEGALADVFSYAVQYADLKSVRQNAVAQSRLYAPERIARQFLDLFSQRGIE